MIIAIDFDETIVSQAGRDYNDVATPLRLMTDAKEALLWLRRAGHILLLYSARANRALRIDPQLDPLIRAGIRPLNMDLWTRSRQINEARYRQMISFVGAELPGIFDAVDDGTQGKPCADMYLDNNAMRLGHGPEAVSWQDVAHMYGEPQYDGGENVREQRAQA